MIFKNTRRGSFFPEVETYLDQVIAKFDTIPEERKSLLSKVADYIRQHRSRSEAAKLTFICTHNSRRSQMCQVWSQVAAQYYGLTGVETYSGGTEATAFNPRAIAALQRSGIVIVASDPQTTNPRYSVRAADESPMIEYFSKVYSDPPNPSQGYCAVMTCSQADDACPLVMGCDLRIPIRYEDPKVADDTPLEAERYDQRAAQICCEMMYLMSLA
jgi:arsenate reductase (thioredoxin)